MQTHDGLWLDVTTYGPDDAPVTVFLAHCWTLDQQDWHYQVRDLLAEHGHGIRIVTWDHRGHGGSSPVTRVGARIELLARDWGDLVDHLAPTGPLVLAGHSIGGMALLALAEQRPDLFERVVGVALVATSAGDLDTVTLGLPDAGPLVRAQIPRVLAFRSLTLSRRARRRAPITERLLMRTLLFGTPVRLADMALAVEGLIRCTAATVVGYYEDCLRHDRATALERFAGIPTHVLVGSRDVLTPPSHARRIADGIPGAVLTVAPGAGHMLPLERDHLVSSTLVGLLRAYAGPALPAAGPTAAPTTAPSADPSPSRGVAS